MKRCFCKSLALSMAILNLCNPVLAVNQDVNEEIVTKNRSNLKSYLVTGLEVVGGVVLSGLAGFGVYSILKNPYEKLKEYEYKNEKIKHFMCGDKKIYNSMYKIYHSRNFADFTDNDVENFVFYICNMSNTVSDEDFKSFPPNLTGISLSKEEIKFYICILSTYERYFEFNKSVSEDAGRVCVGNAFRVFLNSRAYHDRKLKEKTESEKNYQVRIRSERCKFISQLLCNQSILDFKCDGIRGDYLEEFIKKFNEIELKMKNILSPNELSENSNDASSIEDRISEILRPIPELIEEFNNNMSVVVIPPSISCSKELENELNILMLPNGNKILRIGAYNLSLAKESDLLGQCFDSIKNLKKDLDSYDIQLLVSLGDCVLRISERLNEATDTMKSSNQ